MKLRIDRDDAERARRGWVADNDMPYHDPVYERVVRVPVPPGADGLYGLLYEVVPADLALALPVALEAANARAKAAAEGGMVFKDASFATSEKAQGRIKGYTAHARDDKTFAIPHWKVGPGVYVDLSNADLKALGKALIAHVQACFRREAEIAALLTAAPDARALRDTLRAEINKGWPGSETGPAAA